MAIEAQDITDLRTYIGSLSIEWRNKIGLRVNGSLWPFTNLEEKEQNMAMLKKISEGPLEGELTYTEDDPDIPK